ncbi:hypothetical protein JCM8097_007934 [Rhodosporidiobolus ruineniae]
MSTTRIAAVQACCVCGKETSTRCSACANVGIELVFCSLEHQKLVWKDAHSKVCGDKAQPFLWPDLSTDEVEQIKTYKNFDVNGLPRPSNLQLDLHRLLHGMTTSRELQLPSIAKGLTEICGVSEEDFDKVVPPLLLNSKSLPRNKRNQLLLAARSMLRSAVPSWEPADALLRQVGLFPALLRVENHVWARFPQASATKGVSVLLHRSLILFRLLQLKEQSSSSPGLKSSDPYHALRAFLISASLALPFATLNEACVSMDVLSKFAKPYLRFELSYSFNSSLQLSRLNIYPLSTGIQVLFGGPA